MAMDALVDHIERVAFEPTRQAGLARLAAFRGRMGRAYASGRNHDHGPDDRSNVSVLSPWVRTRTVLEAELVGAALEKHTLSSAEKFIQEVCWRTYFKGWLEHRPGVWADYLADRDRQLDRLSTNPALGSAYRAAVAGETGVSGFDAWARELVETGYLHNHARMWFASIWIFTLKLPWALGADFFLNHLLDADAASNTCSWRWVGGLHTAGKTYLARRSNIEKYTGGRFSPGGLAPEAPPLLGDIPPPGALAAGDSVAPGPVALLLTEEDLHVESLCPPGALVQALGGVCLAEFRSPGGAGAAAAAFAEGVVDDAMDRGASHFGLAGAERLPVDGLEAWCRQTGCATIVTGFPPVGWAKPVLDELKGALARDGIALVYHQRAWDQAFWPHARKGFFGLKKAIPRILAELGQPV
ncbi:MAG: FAD-binding domain-containing protein [Pseudomonadota bacterium]